MKRFDFQIKKNVTEQQLIPLVRAAFGLGLGEVVTVTDPIQVVSRTPRVTVRVTNSWDGWSGVCMRIDDSIQFIELEIAKTLALLLHQRIVIDLPEDQWADGYWLLVNPTGTVFNVFIDDNGNIDTVSAKLYSMGKAMSDKNAYCGYCGSAYENLIWPRHCENCKMDTWRNPLPVSVTLCRVFEEKISPIFCNSGVLLVKRSIPPHIGEWALPGGYLDVNETWQEGAARELREETGINVAADRITLWDAVTSPLNHNLLLFNLVSITRAEIPEFVPNNEVSDIKVVSGAEELCFPTHTDYLKRMFGE